MIEKICKQILKKKKIMEEVEISITNIRNL